MQQITKMVQEILDDYDISVCACHESNTWLTTQTNQGCVEMLYSEYRTMFSNTLVSNSTQSMPNRHFASLCSPLSVVYSASFTNIKNSLPTSYKPEVCAEVHHICFSHVQNCLKISDSGIPNEDKRLNNKGSRLKGSVCLPQVGLLFKISIKKMCLSSFALLLLATLTLCTQVNPLSASYDSEKIIRKCHFRILCEPILLFLQIKNN